VGMAVVYASVARLMLAWRPTELRPLLTSVAIAVGFIALTFPIQAEASWIAVGWMAEAVALWWFGQRIQAAPLRVMAAALGVVSALRVVLVDLPYGRREPFLPIFNTLALPPLAVAVLLLVGVLLTRRFLGRLGRVERVGVGMAGVGGVLLLWLVLSVECDDFFRALSVAQSAEATVNWQWIGQMSVSILWTVYASAVLAVGFYARQAWLRWLGIGLFALTVAKVFLYDISQLAEIYRVLAFFVLALFLGLAAWAYQRMGSLWDWHDSSQGE
jgi:uncharacterized membrane protein